MRKSFGMFLSTCLLVATPALAGDLSFDNGSTAWHSSQCVKPNSPTSILSAHPETSGDDMNSLIAQHNAFVDAAQAYMNCVSGEAQHDQSLVNQQIANGAQKTIADMQAEINADAQAIHGRK